MEKVCELFQKLPDDLKREVIDYIEFLVGKESKEKTGTAQPFMERCSERVERQILINRAPA